MTKKTKITYLIIIMAITIIAVAFLFKAKLDETNTSSARAPINTEEAHHHHDHEEENHDHTINAAAAPAKTNIIRIGSQGVESEVEKWTLPVFKSYVNDTFKTLPNLKDARGLKDEEVHQNPKLVMDAGLRLGSIKKQIKLNSEFEEEGMKFYDKCALKKDGLTPVRALCLANLVYMKNQKGEDFELEKYPEKVKDLAQKALELSF